MKSKDKRKESLRSGSKTEARRSPEKIKSPQKEAADRRQSVQEETARKSSLGVINRRQSVTNYDLIDALREN